ncbi:HD domain-containing protein [Synechococcus sp. PCC 6312]|uniref:HD domain-containing protein n=1 Tax=Synechococcus sp. (strain ATCC 27167 / PCC 6312) TaxID=195253 RepID=UPI00029EEE60|nr:HD domain-containing protein [Synechococcus sp. PCC 6312]AFY60089.1 guanosine polyphosphate synthetase/pyrophosphohydrolase [Synechococcus sp. PCC 6312]
MKFQPTQRYFDALEYAATLHKAQTRKGTDIPYISHLAAVATIAIHYGADEDEAIAALLHDAVEDQGGLQTLDYIRNEFGERVAEIVQACSDSIADTIQGEEKLPWKDRKLAYLDHIKTASPSVRLVSASDKLHNAQSIRRDYQTLGDELWNRFNAGKEGTLWYYRSLVEAFREHGDSPLLQTLDEVVTELESVVTPSGKVAT